MVCNMRLAAHCIVIQLGMVDPTCVHRLTATARLSPAVPPHSVCNIVAVQHSPRMPSVGLSIALHFIATRTRSPTFAATVTTYKRPYERNEGSWQCVGRPRLLVLPSTVSVQVELDATDRARVQAAIACMPRVATWICHRLRTL